MTLAEHAAKSVDMAPHVETLRALASECRTIVEFGVRTGVSTWALLDGLPENGRLVSVDIEDVTPPERVTADPRWTLIVADDRTLTDLPQADLVLIDTSHEYHHTLAELTLAASLRARLIVLHDWNLPDVQDAVRGFMLRSGYGLHLIEPSEWGLAVLAR